MESYEYELTFENSNGDRYIVKREYILPRDISKEEVDMYANSRIMEDEELQHSELISYRRIMYEKVNSNGTYVQDPIIEEQQVELDFANTTMVNIYPSSNSSKLMRVDIAKPEDLIPENIRLDKEIFGVTGTLEEKIVNLQEKSCCPATEETIIEPDDGYDGLAVVTVEAVDNTIDENIQPYNIRSGVSILGIEGNVETDKPDQTKEVTPTTSSQSITPDTGYELVEVTVKGVTSDIDENITAENIKKDVAILGVVGTYKGTDDLNLQIKTVNPTSDEAGVVVTADSDYDALKQVKVNPIESYMVTGLTADKIKRGEEILDLVGTYGATSQIKYATPSLTEQIITPDSGIEYLSQVTINPVTSAVDSDITPTNIRRGVNILGIEGTFDGDLNFQNKTVSPSTEENLVVTPDEGYDALDSVTVKKVTSSIDSDIKPENIRNGVEILGIEGTYAPDPSMENKVITPSTGNQIVYPDEGYSYFDKVTVTGVDSSIDSNIKSENIREGIKILGVEGTMESIKGENITINPSTIEQYIQPSTGKNAITSVTVNPVTNEIDDKIISSNIKQGISILGVEGTFNGGISTLQTKTVTPSDTEQVITADEGYDALSSVTIEITPTEDITIEPSLETKTYSRNEGMFINNVTVNSVNSTIDPNIVPENIKQNMSILGVVGTYKGEQQNYFDALSNGTSGKYAGVTKAILSLPDDLAITGTSGDYMFWYLSSLTKIPALDFSSLTTTTYMFAYCSDVTDWSALRSLTAVTIMSYMFYYCKLNTTFLECTNNDGFANVTTMNHSFYYAKLPNAEVVFNLPKVTNMTQAFYRTSKDGSASKITLKLYNTTVNMEHLCNYTTIPTWEITVSDESKYPKANLKDAFHMCSDITKITIHDNVRPTSLYETFSASSSAGEDAPNVDSIEVNLSSCTTMWGAFRYNKNITSIQLNGNSGSVTNMAVAFQGAASATNALTTISGSLNCAKVKNVANMFDYQTNLTNLCALTDLGKAYTQKTANYANYKLNLSACVNLSYESLMNVINGLYDLNLSYGVADGGTLYTQSLVLGATNLAKLEATEEGLQAIANAEAKGWTIS